MNFYVLTLSGQGNQEMAAFWNVATCSLVVW
jgi:hypothetical protein